MSDNIESWLSGPVAGVPALLQPVAHALLQAQKEIHVLVKDLAIEDYWKRPGGLASVGFHLRHIRGVIDRMFTYASGAALSATQFDYLKKEGEQGPDNPLMLFDAEIEKAIKLLGTIDPATLTEFRGVGRKQLPSTVLGLLFHAAEHTMRHTGQLIVTVAWLRDTASA